MKDIYVIFDTVSNQCGELLQFSNDDEAKRAFIHTIFITPTPFRKDLVMYKLGSLVYKIDCPEIIPFKPQPLKLFSSNDEKILAEVSRKTREQVEQNVIQSQIMSKVQDNLNSKFFQNLNLVSTYLTTDKKLLKKAEKELLKRSKNNG